MTGDVDRADALHRLRVDDVHVRAVIFIGVDMARRRIVGDRIDGTADIGRTQNFHRDRIDFGDGIGFAVTGVDVTRCGVDGDAVHRPHADLSENFPRIGVDDRQRAASGMSCVHAATLCVDGDIIEPTIDGNRHGRGYGNKRHALQKRDARTEFLR